jgi:hypothetical protein
MKRRSLLQLAASGAALTVLPLAARAAALDELRLRDISHIESRSS